MDVIRKILLIGISGVILILPSFVSAADKYGLAETAGKTKLAGMSISKSSPELLASQIVTVALGFVGTIFFILVLYGGITWMTAMGSNEKVTRAKSILTTAFLGLVIVVASYALSMFIFTQLAGGEGGINCDGECMETGTVCPKGAGEGACQGGLQCCKK